MNRNNDIMIFFQFLDMSLPPGGQIQKSIWLKCCTLADFMICHKFAIHCACKLWTGMMIFIFFPILGHIDGPGGQIHKSILLKWSTPIHFMICYKIAIHCVCKLWTGMMILWFFPKSSIFRKKMAASRPFWIGWPSFLNACRLSNATHSCKISNS